MLRFFLAFIFVTFNANAEAVMISDAERSKWVPVGRVNLGGFKSKALCSGVLVGPQTVLTAAHCVADPDGGKPYLPYKIKFVASWHKGEFAGVGQAKSVHVHPSYAAKKPGTFPKIAVDIAFITLTEPMQGITPAPMNLSNVAFKEGPVRLLGYRRDRPHVMTDYRGCSAYVFRHAMLSIDCDVTQGTSGAPVFGLRDGIWEVIGVMSSRLENRGRDKALAALVGASTAIDMSGALSADGPSIP